MDDSRQVVAEVRGLKVRSMPAAAGALSSRTAVANALYRMEWVQAPGAADWSGSAAEAAVELAPTRWCVVGECGRAKALAEGLKAEGTLEGATEVAWVVAEGAEALSVAGKACG